MFFVNLPRKTFSLCGILLTLRFFSKLNSLFDFSLFILGLFNFKAILWKVNGIRLNFSFVTWPVTIRYWRSQDFQLREGKQWIKSIKIAERMSQFWTKMTPFCIISFHKFLFKKVLLNWWTYQQGWQYGTLVRYGTHQFRAKSTVR